MKNKFLCTECKEIFYSWGRRKYCSRRCYGISISGKNNHNFGKHKGYNNPMFGKKHSEETKKLFSKQRKGKTNGHDGMLYDEVWCKNISSGQKKRYVNNPELKKQFGLFIKNFFKKYPEKHPNRKMCNTSKPQRELYKYILFLNPNDNIELEYYVKTNKSYKFIDIAIINKKIGIEYDGEYWHKNKKKDKQRDKELEEVGWKIIHYDKEMLKQLKFLVAYKTKEKNKVVVKYKEVKNE